MPLVFGGSSAVAEPYLIANSVRYNPDDSPSLALTFGAPTDNLKWTFSAWVKKCWTSDGSAFVLADVYGTGLGGGPWIAAQDFYSYRNYESSSYDGELITTQKLRDASAWYHIVQVWDSANGTPGDRMKLYINGTEVTSFTTDNNPDLNQACAFNSAEEHFIGTYRGIASYWDGYIAEVVFIDGQALAPTSFGEFNSDSPTIWQPIDPTDLTFGNNGYWLDFADSADLGNDVSGNGNDWTPANLTAADQATDSPTNNFCILNNVATTNGLGVNITFTEGNCFMANTAGGLWEPAIGTLAAKGGKWYGEVKCVALGAGNNIGIMSPAQYNDNMSLDNPATATLAYGMNYSTGAATNGPGNWTTSWGEAYTSGDIISVAMDLDNMKLYFAKNGVWVASGDPTSGATGTGTQTWFGGSGDTTNAAGVDYYTFFAAFHNSSTTATNFGGSSGFAITSANQDANGYGNFEYAVPTGYYALCTKNLAEFGG